MFESLAEWCCFPCTLHRAGKANMAGDKTYTPIAMQCYRVDAVEQLVDANNNAFLSAQHIYLDSSTAITMSDMISFPEDIEHRYAIKKIGAYYDGNAMVKSIQVIYL